MTIKLLAVALAAVAAFTGVAASAGAFGTAAAEVTSDPNRLYADSKLIARDRISVEVIGTGPDVIFVPGLSSSRTTWKRTAERLRSRYRLHIVQVAGFSGEPSGPNATGEVVIPTAEAIDAYIVSAKLAPVAYVGHSLGGTMGLYLAERHPEHLKKVLLVDSLPFYGVIMGGPAATAETIKPTADATKAGILKGTPEQAAASLKQTASFMAKSAEGGAEITSAGGRSDRAVVATAMAEDMTLDLRPNLAAVTPPITLIYPFDAAMGMPEAMWDRLYKGQFAPLKTAKLVRVDDSRHFVMFDQPAKFDAALDAFLAQ